MAFYRDGVGLEGPATDLASVWGLELIEYKDIDRKPAHPRFQGPGSGNLNVRVKDLAAVAARLKKSGAHILTPADVPAEIPGGRE